MRAPLLIVLTMMVMVAQGASARSSSDGTIDSLRKAAANTLRRSDSLRAVWDVLWKRSDSMRIESMFLRMRSDSLKRVSLTQLADIAKREQQLIDSAAVLAEVIADSTVETKVAVAAATAKKPKVPSGRTLSDSITALVMTFKPDTGTASYYAEQFHGKKTSSGETCAHRWLPFNTRLKVTNLANGKEVTVRVTDRGPWKHTRLIDLSKQAAKDLDMIRAGTARVAIEVVSGPEIEEDVPAQTD
jgi:rare lipoprotein A